MKSVQLPLGVQLYDDATFSNFYSGPNALVLATLQQVLSGKGLDHYLYLFGEEGVGRTHLLQAACHEMTTRGQLACYLPLGNPLLTLEALEGLEFLSLVCLDDVHAIAGIPQWEEAIFHLFNRIRAREVPLLVSGDQSPIHLSIRLPDLKSRLAWGTAFEVHPLSDDDKLFALQLHAKARGLVLSDEVGRFLLRRCARDMRELYAILTELDTASLSAQRRLTIPFIKESLCL